jgi:hypothetical protein
MNVNWSERIVIDPAIQRGEPCITGTRVPVSILKLPPSRLSRSSAMSRCVRGGAYRGVRIRSAGIAYKTY